MKYRNKKRPGLKLTAAAVSFLGGLFLLGYYYCGSAVGMTAALSAGLYSPQTAFRAIEREMTARYMTGTAAGYSVSSVAGDSAAVLQSSDVQPVEPAGSDVYETPKDILQMADGFKEVYGSAAHDGKIVGKQYTAANATSVYGNVAVRNTTQSHSVNIEQSLKAPLELSIPDKSKPTVLIFHTHTTEAYEYLDEGWFTCSYSTRSKDPSRNMVRVGDAICEELEKQGIGVIHDTEIHDLKYTGAYEHSRQRITQILADNPTIQISIDVHRDAIHNSDTLRTKPVTEINGKKAAQVMIIAGCQDGKVSVFEGWEKNLTFDLRFQKTAETMFPTLMRPVLFSGRKYNMDLLPCSALFEFGSDSNTLAEAEYSGHLIGMALAQFINENAG